MGMQWRRRSVSRVRIGKQAVRVIRMGDAKSGFNLIYFGMGRSQQRNTTLNESAPVTLTTEFANPCASANVYLSITASMQQYRAHLWDMFIGDKQTQESWASLTSAAKASATPKSVSPESGARLGGEVAAAATGSLASVIPVTEQPGKPSETGLSFDASSLWVYDIDVEDSYFKIGA